MNDWSFQLAGYAWSERATLFGLLCLTLLNAALVAVAPWPLKLIIDYVLAKVALPDNVSWVSHLPAAGTSVGLLAWLVLGTLAMFAATRGAQWLKVYLEAIAGVRLKNALGADLFDHMQRLSFRFHTKAMVGDLMRRVTEDCNCVADLCLRVYLPMFGSLATLVIMFSIMWQLDATVTITAMCFTAPLGLFCYLLSPQIGKYSYTQQQLEGRVMSVAEQALTALPVVQAFNATERETSRFHEVSVATVGAYVNLLLSQLWFKVCIESTTAFGAAIILAIGGFHVLEGDLTLGGLVVILAYLAALYAPVETLAHLMARYAVASAQASRVIEVFRIDDEVCDPVSPKLLPVHRVKGGRELRFEHVTFGYEPTRPVLKCINLDVQCGEVVALVGETGAGKSTLASLVLRFFDPCSGRITIDGMDIRDLRVSDVRSQTAIVLQDPCLLPLTVAENIAYGRPSARRNEIIAAAELAGADSFVRELPHGFDTVIGERGASLSGGERQRLAIARAFLKDAPILILDEPTAALDAQMEAQVVESLEHLMSERTTLIIAHRLSTIRHANRIVVLKNGAIIEAGTAIELLGIDSNFRRMHDLQFGESTGTEGYGAPIEFSR